MVVQSFLPLLYSSVFGKSGRLLHTRGGGIKSAKLDASYWRRAVAQNLDRCTLEWVSRCFLKILLNCHVSV